MVKYVWARNLFFLLLIISAMTYVYINRYYFRFLPLPLDNIHLVYENGYFTPSTQTAALNGTLSFPEYDMATEKGLRAMLNYFQKLSPSDRSTGQPIYADITFEKWIKEITTKPFFCTDGSQLVIAAAKQQGLKAREWQLLLPGWRGAGGHSVAEIFNPVHQRWQLVDGQHAAIIKDVRGYPLDMADVLRLYRRGETGSIKVDYGPFKQQMREGLRGPSVEQYFFDMDLLSTPVMKMRQPTWFETVKRKFGLSGHFVIGYPIVVHDWTHDHRVWTSKVVALIAFLFSVILMVDVWRYRGAR